MSLLAACEALRVSLSGFDARLLSGEDAAAVVEALARVEKVCAAARVQAAARAAECGAHREQGYANPSEWLARETGSSSGEARGDLELAAGLEDLDDTRAAVEAGELSLREAREVQRTEEACPGSEHEMLDAARREGLRGVKRRGRRKRQEAMDPEELAAKRHAARELRHWSDELGMICGQFRLEPEIGVPIIRGLDAEVDRRWRAGDDQYRREPREARAADALAALLEDHSTSRPRRRRVDLVAVYDLNSGRAHIPGVGPIGHDTVRDLATDAIVTTLLHEGTKLDSFVRYGRHIPEALRTLIEIGPAPDFDGPRCLDCGRHFHLELDHVDPDANGGPISYHNIKPRCPHCHRTKTQRDRQAGLLHGEGRAPP